MSAAGRERQKTISTWLNTASAGSVIAGVVTPVVAYQNGLSPNLSEAAIVSSSGTWFAIGIFLHIFALICLTGLQES